MREWVAFVIWVSDDGRIIQEWVEADRLGPCQRWSGKCLATRGTSAAGMRFHRYRNLIFIPRFLGRVDVARQFPTFGSMSSHVNTDHGLRRRANRIAIASAAIAFVAAVASILSFAVPTGLAYFNDKRHEKDLVAALTSSDWQTARTAQEHVVEESAADHFIQNMDAWWYSADWAGDGTDPKPESAARSLLTTATGYACPSCCPGTSCVPNTMSSSTILLAA